MSTAPLLIELGVEEIPDGMIVSAVNQLGDLTLKMLSEKRLGGKLRMAEGTPRRLVVIIDDVLEQQADSVDLIMGPPKSAAYKDGNPTPAAVGFAKKNSVEVSDLHIETTPKGEYIALRKKVDGCGAHWILREEIPLLIPKINFPKAMYWTGKNGPRFIRPIRWILAMHGASLCDFEFAGVHADYYTLGHRRMSTGSFAVNADSYVERLEEYGVIVRAEARRERILDGVAVLSVTRKLRPVVDEALLETLVYLTEYPTPILGAFDPEFLTLPEEVLTTVMRHHQKYFSVTDSKGKLAPYFIAVMNIAADPEGVVRSGNERVLKARFNDARFFWNFDQRRKLSERVADLAHVTFQEKLGSYLDKTKRMMALVKELGGNAHAERAVELSKCDLTTEMVKEFTELQGQVGGLYARAQGEPEPVAKAIYEHYKPTSMEDSIPSTAEGCTAALADKVDTLRGCFGIGLIPTGSKDPLALRRAAQGVIKILVEAKLAVPLSKLAGGNKALQEFFVDRLRYYCKDVRNFAYDEVNAVLAAASDDLPDVMDRLAAIQKVRPTADFEPLAASFKRIKNILKQADFTLSGSVDASRLEPGPEASLHAAFEKLRADVASRRSAKDHSGALTSIASLRPAVDLFFDKVLVNATDEAVRRNRLTLLATVLNEFSSIADFSEIVTTTEQA